MEDIDMDDEFTLDDEDFALGSGRNQITDAYASIFTSAKEAAERGYSAAIGGNAKGISNMITELSRLSASLSKLTQLDTKIVGPTGQTFNVFGQEITVSDDDDASSANMSEDDLAAKIKAIVDGTGTISISETLATIAANNKKNIEDDGLSHGDLDDFSW